MSTEHAGVQDRHGQANVPEEKPSFVEIVRAFGVTIGPSVLLDLFVAASTLFIVTGRIMRPKKGTARLLQPLAILGTVLPWVYALLVRPWHLRWGAKDEEVSKPLPGDELVPNPAIESTRAITVNAPLEAVWPWLAQIGQGRILQLRVAREPGWLPDAQRGERPPRVAAPGGGGEGASAPRLRAQGCLLRTGQGGSSGGLGAVRGGAD